MSGVTSEELRDDLVAEEKREPIFEIKPVELPAGTARRGVTDSGILCWQGMSDSGALCWQGIDDSGTLCWSGSAD
ncbi:MAG TPA: hypothetical protein VF070_35170 [Streptosporangiaceae bacterium]